MYRWIHSITKRISFRLVQWKGISIYFLYCLDTLALRFVAGNTITIGDYEKARDTFAWTLAFWTEDMEFYPNVLALWGFYIGTSLESRLLLQLILIVHRWILSTLVTQLCNSCDMSHHHTDSPLKFLFYQHPQLLMASAKIMKDRKLLFRVVPQW